MISQTKGTKWRVNEIAEGEVDIYIYQFNQKTLAILLACTNCFTDWQAPNFFEDLSFFNVHQEESLLGVIGHENMAFWQVNDSEYQELVALGVELYLN